MTTNSSGLHTEIRNLFLLLMNITSLTNVCIFLCSFIPLSKSFLALICCLVVVPCTLSTCGPVISKYLLTSAALCLIPTTFPSVTKFSASLILGYPALAIKSLTSKALLNSFALYSCAFSFNVASATLLSRSSSSPTIQSEKSATYILFFLSNTTSL